MLFVPLQGNKAHNPLFHVNPAAYDAIGKDNQGDFSLHEPARQAPGDRQGIDYASVPVKGDIDSLPAPFSSWPKVTRVNGEGPIRINPAHVLLATATPEKFREQGNTVIDLGNGCALYVTESIETVLAALAAFT